MAELCKTLRLRAGETARLDALRERLRAAARHYRNLIATVPSDLPGAPFDMSLTKRHEWTDAYILNPTKRLREALLPENRPLLSTWPEYMAVGPMPDLGLLDRELDKLENLGHYLWVNARQRRAANVSPAWEIKYEIVRAIAAIFADAIPELSPTRGTYDSVENRYRGSFPEAIILAFREITGIEGERLDRQITALVQGDSE